MTLVHQDDKKVAGSMLHWSISEISDIAWSKESGKFCESGLRGFISGYPSRKFPVRFKVDETNLLQMADATSRNYQLLEK